jgi:hypothetical protein
MATIPKSSDMSARLRARAGSAFTDGNSQALANASESWFAAVTECQREMMGFVSMRLEKDGAAMRDMMACKSPADISAIQSRWIEDTMRDYNNEMNKLMTICTQSMNRGAGTKG